LIAYLGAMTFETPFQHIFKPGLPDKHPLLLLHGTGGNEHDLVDLAETVAPGRALLSPRGRVLENGMPRFFRRFAEGKFDEEDVRVRAAELASFVRDASKAYGISKPIALGFSNGANIAAALLTLYPDLLAGAVLLRAMAPFKSMPPTALTGVPILLQSGAQDTMIPKPDSDRLAAWLRENGATLTHHTLPTGHGLTQTDVSHMTQFLAQQD
jgi:phospholipase/carboxylesterase